MRVMDLNGIRVIKDMRELEELLSQKSDTDINNFTLSDENGGCPLLDVLVNGNLASLHYWFEQDHPGFRSFENLPPTESRGTTSFDSSNLLGDRVVSVDNLFVVPRSLAIDAAKEFFLTQELPNCVKWMEL